MDESKGEIEVRPSPLVFPARAEEVVEAVKAFDWFKRNVLTENDYVEIQGKPYVKKSGWLKYAMACAISLQLLEERVETRDGDLIYHITYRAIAPGGRYADAVGSASRLEVARRRNLQPEEVYDHHIRALAQTRAANRAISCLVGGGEISAEELEVPAAPQSKTPGSLEELDYKLSHHISNYREYVSVEERINGWLIKRRRYLDQAVWQAINDVVHSMGGKWIPEEEAWLIPRR